jgi:hypothetical protein
MDRADLIENWGHALRIGEAPWVLDVDRELGWRSDAAPPAENIIIAVGWQRDEGTARFGRIGPVEPYRARHRA